MPLRTWTLIPSVISSGLGSFVSAGSGVSLSSGSGVEIDELRGRRATASRVGRACRSRWAMTSPRRRRSDRPRSKPQRRRPRRSGARAGSIRRPNDRRALDREWSAVPYQRPMTHGPRSAGSRTVITVCPASTRPRASGRRAGVCRYIAQSLEPLDEDRVVRHRRRLLEQLVEHLVVACRRHLEALLDRLFLHAGVLPPGALEIEDLDVSFWVSSSM